MVSSIDRTGKDMVKYKYGTGESRAVLPADGADINDVMYVGKGNLRYAGAVMTRKRVCTSLKCAAAIRKSEDLLQ